MPQPGPNPLVAIACGGTGGHLFPGLAIGDSLQELGAHVLYLVSNKEVDRTAVRGLPPNQVLALPAIGLTRHNGFAFLRGLARAWQLARTCFHSRPPAAVLAMGGFTSAAPTVAARRHHAATFLHEANAIPGRANRWLAHFVNEAFVFFPDAAGRLWHPHVRTVGMPVRPQFLADTDPAACRAALGLRPADPVLLVTGGSQGAHALNDLMVRTLPGLLTLDPHLQILHLTGENDCAAVRHAGASHPGATRVLPFLTEMELALGAATAMVSRAGASSLAETAARRVPALLIPLPSAADNHQHFNALAFVETGAARMLPQADATPARVLEELRPLLSGPARATLQERLGRWHSPAAAQTVARAILDRLACGHSPVATASPGTPPPPARPRLLTPRPRPAPVAPPS